MIVLGLNFGHDASACVVRDGKVVVNISRERNSRVKSAMQLRAREIDMALAEAGITIDDVDYCAITTSQGYPYTFFEGSDLTAAYASVDENSVPMSKPLENYWRGAFSQVRRHDEEAITRFKGDFPPSHGLEKLQLGG